jgi:formate dehydrogenase subunit gamma
VLRFDATERWMHWAFSVPFLLLLITGIALGLPQTEVLLTHRDLIRAVHLASAVALVALPAAVWLAGNRRSLRRDAREIDRWDRRDWQWLRRAPWPFRRLALPPQGRFNAGQKLNSILVTAAAVGFVVTGIFMWKAEAFPIWLGDVSTQAHDLLTIAVIPLVIGHIIMAALNPRTNQALGSVFHGYVDAGWARAHHGHWVP